MTNVGIIGVGYIGKLFIDRLIEQDHSVTVYDIDDEQSAYAKDQGGTVAESPAEVARETDALVLALPGTPEVEATMEGEDGVLAELHPDQLVIDATTTLPETSSTYEHRCAKQDAMFIEAPITGAAPRDGYHMMVGGSEVTYDAAADLLDVLCDDHRYIGAAGKATVFKYGLQMRYAGQWALDAEIIEFVRDHDVDPTLFNEFLGMDMQEKYFTGDFTQDIEGLGGLSIWHKDIGYSQQTAHRTNTALPINESVHEAYKATMRRVDENEGHATALIKYWQALNGEE